MASQLPVSYLHPISDEDSSVFFSTIRRCSGFLFEQQCFFVCGKGRLWSYREYTRVLDRSLPRFLTAMKQTYAYIYHNYKFTSKRPLRGDSQGVRNHSIVENNGKPCLERSGICRTAYSHAFGVKTPLHLKIVFNVWIAQHQMLIFFACASNVFRVLNWVWEVNESVYATVVTLISTEFDVEEEVWRTVYSWLKFGFCRSYVHRWFT